MNTLVNDMVKLAVRRPRPYVYDDTVDAGTRSSADAGLSFYSMHTSTAISMATATSYLFTARHPESPWVAPLCVGTYAVAATVGTLRVQAGAHFWTDVVVGAAAGSAVGLLVPLLHRVATGAGGEEEGGGVRITPYVGGDGGGLVLSL